MNCWNESVDVCNGFWFGIICGFKDVIIVLKKCFIFNIFCKVIYL